MSNLSSVADDFIVLYYRYFTYNRQRITDFYSETAEITRENIKKPISEVENKDLLPELKEGTQIEIIDSIFESDNEESFKLQVIANYIFEKTVRKMTQKFEISKKDEKWFIISDALEFSDLDAPLVSKEQLKEIPNFSKNTNKKRQTSPRRKPNQQNKFAPYIPNNQ